MVLMKDQEKMVFKKLTLIHFLKGWIAISSTKALLYLKKDYDTKYFGKCNDVPFHPPEERYKKKLWNFQDMHIKKEMIYMKLIVIK